MANGELCQRCGARPAVAQTQLRQPGQPPAVQRLCRVCLQEMRSGQGARPGTFDEFFAQFFGQGGPPHPAGGPQQIDITRLFSQATRQALHQAAHKAVEWGSRELDSDHLLWAVLSDEAVQLVLQGTGIDPEMVAREVEAHTEKREPTETAPSLSPDAKRVLLAAFEESRQLGVDYIGPEHILLGLTRDSDSAAGEVLREAGVDAAQLHPPVARGGGGEGRQGRQASSTPTLDEHSRDLTAAASDGELDPVIGRDDEIEQTIEVLSRRTKNNPVLIGEAGVGKTAIVEGIAQRIIADEVPETLEGKRLLNLNLGGMVAGTRHRGDFEERIQRMLDEVTRYSDDLILFIDELHTIVGAGSAEGSVDAANMLKPALARGTLHAIGATTQDEYRKHIEGDPALERRFQPITVPEPTVEETIQILCGLKDRYEAFHRVRITGEAITAAAELSDRYVTDRFLPDKAIDLIDQASARIRLRHRSKPARAKLLEDECRQLRRDKNQAVAAENYEQAEELRKQLAEKEAELQQVQQQAAHQTSEITAQHVAEVVARATGVPVSQLTEEERERLLALEERLHRRVVDQSEAIDAIAEAVRRSRAGLGDPDRPVGSFLFLGPTGVGKTETARALAEALFGDEHLMVRFDMSEFQERHTVSRLIGAPPGYVGYEEAGQLTEQVRNRPYAVLLFDEIEKAHPDIFNSLLQVLDDGRLTDAKGRTVDFKNTVIIMTSNLGSERIAAHGQPLGFAPQPAGGEFEQIQQDLREVLRRELRPEFLNRIDEIVVFRPLSEAQLKEVTGLLVDHLTQRMAARGIQLQCTDEAVAWLSQEGHDPEFGARPLQRTIQRHVENGLSRMVLDGSLDDGDLVTVAVEDGRLSFDVDRGGGTQTAEGHETTGTPEPAAAGPSGRG